MERTFVSLVCMKSMLQHSVRGGRFKVIEIEDEDNTDTDNR